QREHTFSDALGNIVVTPAANSSTSATASSSRLDEYTNRPLLPGEQTTRRPSLTLRPGKSLPWSQVLSPQFSRVPSSGARTMEDCHDSSPATKSYTGSRLVAPSAGTPI